MQKPEFVTFTGLDESVDMGHLKALSDEYPVEWGVLFSKDRTGKEKRFPALKLVEHCYFGNGLTLSAHVCGKWARDIVAGDWPEITMFLRGNFRRFQVNVGSYEPDAPAHVQAYGGSIQAWHGILQTRDRFPVTDEVDWLFDPSGGRGESPKEWPKTSHLNPGFCGYAGGIAPHNIKDVLSAISVNHLHGKPFWIDMEGQIRSHDFLDLDKCEAVLKSVYGAEDSAHEAAMSGKGEA